jgi:hypothetical protein
MRHGGNPGCPPVHSVEDPRDKICFPTLQLLSLALVQIDSNEVIRFRIRGSDERLAKQLSQLGFGSIAAAFSLGLQKRGTKTIAPNQPM